MGLLNIFKKKSEEPVQEHLSLETLLQKAATEPAYRGAFYQQLLSDNLVVITNNTNAPEGEYTLPQNATVNIISYPDGRIPVFTSTERIFDKGVVTEEVAYMEMKGRQLFELAKGATFLLNPYSDYGKELLPEEITMMLSGKILGGAPETITIKKDTEVQIGQPAHYPTEMVQSLKELFATTPNIRAAYLGWMFNPESGEPPHYILGLDAEGDLHSVAHEAGRLAQQFLSPDEFVDFIKIDDKGGISDYFLESVEPFYKR